MCVRDPLLLTALCERRGEMERVMWSGFYKRCNEVCMFDSDRVGEEEIGKWCHFIRLWFVVE